MSTFLRLVITVTAFAIIAGCDDDKPKSAYAPVRTCGEECGSTNPGVVSGAAPSGTSSGDSDTENTNDDESGFDEPFLGSSGSGAANAGSGSFGISGVAGAGIPDPAAGTGGSGGS